MGCGVSTQEGGISPQEANNGRNNQSTYEQDEASPAANQEAADRFASSGKAPASPRGATTDSIDNNGAANSPHFSDRSHLSEKEQEQIKEISARRRKQKTLSTNPESLDHYRIQTGKIEDDDEYYPKKVELSESMSEREGTHSVNSMDLMSLGTSSSSVGLNGSTSVSKSALKKRNSQWARGSISNSGLLEGGVGTPVSTPQHQQQPEYLTDPMECFIEGNVDEKNLALLFPIRINHNASTSSPPVAATPPFNSNKGLTGSSSLSLSGLTGSQMLPPRLGEEGDPYEDQLMDELGCSGSMRKSVRFSIHTTLNGSN